MQGKPGYGSQTKKTESKGPLQSREHKETAAADSASTAESASSAASAALVASATPGQLVKDPAPTFNKIWNVRYEGFITKDFPIGCMVVFIAPREQESNCKIGKIPCDKREGEVKDYTGDRKSLQVKFLPHDDYSVRHQYSQVPERWVVRKESLETYDKRAYYMRVPPAAIMDNERRKPANDVDTNNRKYAESHKYEIKELLTDLINKHWPAAIELMHQRGWSPQAAYEKDV